MSDTGEVMQYGIGKTVPYGDYKNLEEKHKKILAENNKLNKEVELLKAKLSDIDPEGQEENKAKGKGR